MKFNDTILVSYQKERKMKIFDDYGQFAEKAEERHTPFSGIAVGEIFKQSGRILIRIEDTYIPECGRDSNSAPYFQKKNALRLHCNSGGAGRFSYFQVDTQCTRLPRAALYLKG
jgi:hypothetical protein